MSSSKRVKLTSQRKFRRFLVELYITGNYFQKIFILMFFISTLSYYLDTIIQKKFKYLVSLVQEKKIASITIIRQGLSMQQQNLSFLNGTCISAKICLKTKICLFLNNDLANSIWIKNMDFAQIRNEWAWGLPNFLKQVLCNTHRDHHLNETFR